VRSRICHALAPGEGVSEEKSLTLILSLSKGRGKRRTDAKQMFRRNCLLTIRRMGHPMRGATEPTLYLFIVNYGLDTSCADPPYFARNHNYYDNENKNKTFRRLHAD
jgi:hypothetical protein